MVDLKLLQRKIGFYFNDLSLLELALVHSSFINENPGLAANSNERLEFLGDAVLGLVIAERLYQDFPDYPEGELTRLRSALVRREALAQIASRIELGEFLSLGKGEEAGGGRSKPANLAGALEALIASIYFDKGLATARDFILNLFGEEIYQIAQLSLNTDYKSLLQEKLQAQKQIAPAYNLLEASGPDHDRQFTIEVKAGNDVLGRGTGKSKKAAEMDAARAALKHLSDS